MSNQSLENKVENKLGKTSLKEKVKRGMAKALLPFVVAGSISVGALGLAGCATTGGYAGDDGGWVVDSETAFKYMRFPRQRGEKIVFDGRAPPVGERDIFIIDTEGSNLKNLTNTPYEDEGIPEWTIDDKIVYASGESPLKYYIINQDGSNKREISREAYVDLRLNKR